MYQKKKNVNLFYSDTPNLGDKIILESCINLLEKENIAISDIFPFSKFQLSRNFKLTFSDINIVVGHPLVGLSEFEIFIKEIAKEKKINPKKKFFAFGLGLRYLSGINFKQLDVFDYIATRDDELYDQLKKANIKTFKSACLSIFVDKGNIYTINSNDNEPSALVFPCKRSFLNKKIIKFNTKYWYDLKKYLMKDGYKYVDFGLVDPRDEKYFAKLKDESTKLIIFNSTNQLKSICAYKMIISARLHMAIYCLNFAQNLNILKVDLRMEQFLKYFNAYHHHDFNVNFFRNAKFNSKNLFFFNKELYNKLGTDRYPKKIFNTINELL